MTTRRIRRTVVLFSLIAGCLTIAGCLSVPFDIAEGVVDTTFSVAEAVVVTPISIAGDIVDIPGDISHHFKHKYTEERNWMFAEEGVNRIHLRTVNGSVTVRGTGQDRIEIHSWKEVKARSESKAETFADRIELYAKRDGDEIRIGRKHPKPPRHVNYSIRYEVRIPRTMNLDLSTTNGRIRVDGVHGNLHVRTTNGSIELDHCSGSVNAETTNARIKVNLDRLEGEGTFDSTNGSIHVSIAEGIAPIGLESTNGSLHLALPADYDGMLDVKTSNGSIHSDFPVVVRKMKKNQLSGRIGAGGDCKVVLRSTNGSIHLKNSWE